MKKEYLFFAVIGCVVAILLWFACHFQRSQETYFNTTREKLASLQREAIVLADHLDFIKTHEKELNVLRKKGWFKAHHRLIVGEFLDKLGSSLHPKFPGDFVTMSVRCLGL